MRDKEQEIIAFEEIELHCYTLQNDCELGIQLVKADLDDTNMHELLIKMAKKLEKCRILLDEITL